LVYAGVVVKASAGNGRVYVKVQNGYELDEIHDVLISSPANNEVLTYETSTGLWKNKSNPADGVTSITATSPLTGGTITSTGSIGLDLTDIAPKASPTFTGTVTTPVLSGSILYTDASGVLGKVGNAPNVGFIPYTAAVAGGMSWQSLGLLAKTNAANAFTVGGHTITAESAGVIPLTLLAASGQTADLAQFKDASSNVVTKVNSAGLVSTTRNITIAETNAGENALIIQGAASHTASYLLMRNSSGAITANFTAPVNNVNRLNLGGTDLSATFGITVHASGGVGQVIRGAASQSANLQEWQNSAATVLVKVDSGGSIWAPTYQSSNGYSTLGENTAGGSLKMIRATGSPTTPGTNAGRLYFKAGTTGLALYVQGPTGTEIRLADNIT
jgi:hypothetical protein